MAWVNPRNWVTGFLSIHFGYNVLKFLRGRNNMVDLVDKQLGPVALDVSFSGGNLVVTLGDAAVGISNILSISEKMVLSAILAKMPAGSSEASIGGMIVSVVEAASGAS
jgi:hypothetical protein